MVGLYLWQIDVLYFYLLSLATFIQTVVRRKQPLLISASLCHGHYVPAPRSALLHRKAASQLYLINFVNKGV
jgi:hypothetical protein